jgi:hypothetical protein
LAIGKCGLADCGLRIGDFLIVDCGLIERGLAIAKGASPRCNPQFQSTISKSTIDNPPIRNRQS